MSCRFPRPASDQREPAGGAPPADSCRLLARDVPGSCTKVRQAIRRGNIPLHRPGGRVRLNRRACAAPDGAVRRWISGPVPPVRFAPPWGMEKYPASLSGVVSRLVAAGQRSGSLLMLLVLPTKTPYCLPSSTQFASAFTLHAAAYGHMLSAFPLLGTAAPGVSDNNDGEGSVSKWPMRYNLPLSVRPSAVPTGGPPPCAARPSSWRCSWFLPRPSPSLPSGSAASRPSCRAWWLNGWCMATFPAFAWSLWPMGLQRASLQPPLGQQGGVARDGPDESRNGSTSSCRRGSKCPGPREKLAQHLADPPCRA